MYPHCRYHNYIYSVIRLYIDYGRFGRLHVHGRQTAKISGVAVGRQFKHVDLSLLCQLDGSQSENKRS